MPEHVGPCPFRLDILSPPELCEWCKGWRTAVSTLAPPDGTNDEPKFIPCPDCNAGVVYIKGGDPEWCERCDGHGRIPEDLDG